MNNLPLQFVLLLGERFSVVVHVVLAQHQLNVLQLLTARQVSHILTQLFVPLIFTRAVNKFRSAQPSQFSTYPSQYIDTPVLAVLSSDQERLESSVEAN